MQPTWVVIENVDGIGTMEQSDYEIDLEGETAVRTEADMVLETIRKDFESAGYQTLMLEIPACAVNTRHRRDRYFIVAHSGSRGFCKSDICGEQQGRTEVISAGEIMGYTECSRLSGESRRGTGQEPTDGYSGNESGIVADTSGTRSQDREQPRGWENAAETKTRVEPEFERCSQDVADTSGRYDNNAGRGTSEICGKQSKKTKISGLQRWPTQSGMGGMLDELSHRIHGFRQPAYMGQPQYQWEPSRTATGVKNRTNRLKALGNAVDPLQIYPLLQIIYWIENGAS
jgi:DNA (cytosine-5)-methyltransferase 1